MGGSKCAKMNKAYYFWQLHRRTVDMPQGGKEHIRSLSTAIELGDKLFTLALKTFFAFGLVSTR